MKQEFNTYNTKHNQFTGLLTLSAVIIFTLALCTGLRAEELAGKKASLWRTNSKFAKIYTDPKASGINDIVTIQISETSSASNKAELTTSKKTSINMGITNLLGLETQANLNSGFDNTSMFNSSTDNSHEGEGETTRESTLTAYITGRVIDVMTNGNLVIQAKKEVMVNKEKQIAVLTGIIRPRDISYNNVVQSNNISDMQIKFTGKGPVSRTAKRGWLSWLINTIWPF
ncbi:MAG: flagellar basal body L-ring protein FlgH [bacterium]|nr:flagellar basal body L-ring protein FlgH [bacterium]